jgi:4-hydroxy-tetrahydrodipicolinate reductase
VRLLLIGHGRMGRLVEQHAAAHGCEVAGVVRSASAAADLEARDFGAVDAVVDFSLAAAVKPNLERIAHRRWNAVIGTTGWQADEAACRSIADRAGIGVLAAANFSIGMTVFRMIVEEAARRFAGVGDVGAFVHELHHSAKKDAPSGTALMLKAAMERAGYSRTIDMSSTRAGSIPGTHQIGFDASAETVALTHTVRDRAVFAHGALEAAKWIKGKKGWFGVEDLIKTKT